MIKDTVVNLNVGAKANPRRADQMKEVVNSNPTSMIASNKQTNRL